jgi:molybdate transport system substrate-binding protein
MIRTGIRPLRASVRARLLAAACALLPGIGCAGEVQVASAANFAGPLAKIVERFSAATGHTVKVSAGPTGKFHSQILAGAPYEVLIAADEARPKMLVDAGHAVAGTARTYAIGQLVLWSAQPGRVDEKGAVLAGGRFERLAIANPRLAPYGAAALEVLRASGLTDALAPKLVTGDSIAQTYQFVLSGNADLGFVALSQVAVPGKPLTGSMWKVPQSLYSEIRQDAVLLKAGENNPAARALLDYLHGPEALAVIEAYGYRPAPAP